MKFTKDRVEFLKNGFKGKKIAVIGDMMIDSYIWGDVKRISPEAPVPVVDVEKEFDRFGGAANVAFNIISLGGIPYPVGIIGNDDMGEKFNNLLNEAEINSSGIFKSEKRPTTSKTRVIAENQQVVRFDKEWKNDISEKEESLIIEFIKGKIKELDAIILEDYNKGVLTKNVIREVIKVANENNVLVTVDPKYHNFTEYQNVTVFKPNRKEAEDALGISINTKEDVINAGNTLLEKLNAENVLLTLGKEGMALFSNLSEVEWFSTKARNVADVSGAGDTVISTLTIALASGAKLNEATYLANYAGGIVCETPGIVPIELDQLFETITNGKKDE